MRIKEVGLSLVACHAKNRLNEGFTGQNLARGSFLELECHDNESAWAEHMLPKQVFSLIGSLGGLASLGSESM